VLYLPTEGLYAEVARVAGLMDDLNRQHRVIVLGPCLLPALLRTIQLGHVTLALSRNADSVRELLGATKMEMQKMDTVLGQLARQVGTVGNTIQKAQTRTRAVARKLRGVEGIGFERSEQLLELAEEELQELEMEPASP
jgi:DNA recombination protein RmuC